MPQSPITRAARLALATAAAAATVLMLGPFSGAEHVFFLSDKEAHVLAFYGLTTLALLAAPNLRKNDIAIAAVAMATAIEIAQGLVGREVSVVDLAASALGAAMAWAGAQAETLRRKSKKPLVADRRRPLQAAEGDRAPTPSTPPI